MSRASTTILKVAVAFQVVLVAAAVFSFFQGSRYAEFSLRRGAEHAAVQAVAQWVDHLEQVADRLPRSSSFEEAHLLPIPTLDRARLVRTYRVPENSGRPLPGKTEELWVSWPSGLGGGLSGVAAVRARPACRFCHPSVQVGEVVGALEFQVETRFLAKLLAARRANVASLVAGVFLATSGLMWALTFLAVRRQRRMEEARALAEEALRASEERYRALVEHSLVGVYLIQGDRLVFCNRRAAEIFGYGVEELVGKPVWDVIAPEEHALVAENLRKRLTGEVESVRYAITGVRKDGSRFRAEVFGSRVQLPSGPAVLGMILDITAQEEAHTLLENAYRAAVALPGENTFDAAAAALASFLGVPVAFVAAREGDDLRVLGGFGPIRDQVLRFSGTPCARVMEEKAPLELPQGYLGSNGCASLANLNPESYFGFPLLASDGEALGVLAVLDTKPRRFSPVERQILEIYAVRLGRELEREHLLRQQRELEAKLAAREKLAALGELAGGVAHDFNNVLAGITAEAESLQRRLPPDQAARLGRVLELAQRGADVVRRILAFARPGVAKPVPVSVSEIVEDSVELARHTFGPSWQWETQVQPGLYVLGEEATLQQAILNILANARDALPRGGPVAVRAYHDNASVVLEVEDRGAGIAPEHLSRVFEPFFTTKPRGQGTGLGLSTALRTVEAHGGTIHIDSRLGEGTKVTVRLPAAEAPAERTGETKAGVEGGPGGSRVLLVDDERSVLEGLEELLEMEGFSVVTASSAEEALAVFQPGAFDVAVVDVLLPGVSGIALAQKLIQSDPQLALVFASGHTPEVLPHELASRPRVMFLQKPFSVRALLDTLRSVLT